MLQDSDHQPTRILLTGSTGYIGGRLAPRLLQAGYRVRCFVREPKKLDERGWSNHPLLEVTSGDANNEADLIRAMTGCQAAFYLIHSMMSAGPQYRQQDQDLAQRFARCSEQSGIERIIYLGGLGETGEGLSEHLASRREVEQALGSTTVPVTVFRAAMIIGSGSASFEILRYLVERLPVMVTPKWVGTESQPIAVRNVLHYLVKCLDTPSTIGRTLDIGGRDVMSYREILQVMAKALGLRKRLIIPVPVLTPRLSSLWIHLVTPLSHRIARPLAEGLRNRVVCRDDAAVQAMPQELLSVSEAIDAALGGIQNHDVETVWSDAGKIAGDPDWAGGKVFVDEKSIKVNASTESVFNAVCRIGGGQGYYAADWLWRLRGFMDRMVGGPGLRRGRRNPELVAYGEALDFWRVTNIERNKHLELRAEMKLPGEATLEFEISPLPDEQHNCRLIQRARFKPRGLFGIAYWYAVLPFHNVVFKGMLEGIRKSSETPVLFKQIAKPTT
jgi:uncharacterized protein YbjT (DUF2867 family)